MLRFFFFFLLTGLLLEKKSSLSVKNVLKLHKIERIKIYLRNKCSHMTIFVRKTDFMNKSLRIPFIHFPKKLTVQLCFNKTFTQPFRWPGLEPHTTHCPRFQGQDRALQLYDAIPTRILVLDPTRSASSPLWKSKLEAKRNIGCRMGGVY